MNKDKVGKAAEQIFYKIFAKQNLDYQESLATLEMVRMWIICEYTMDFMKDQDRQIDEKYEEEEFEEEEEKIEETKQEKPKKS